MTKNELIKVVNEKVDGRNQKLIDAVLAAYAEVVTETLANNRNEKIPLPNVGTFSVKHVPERSSVAALAGGKPWTKPEHDEISFKIAKSVKELD